MPAKQTYAVFAETLPRGRTPRMDVLGCYHTLIGATFCAHLAWCPHRKVVIVMELADRNGKKRPVKAKEYQP